jgi:hypothetical protein
MHPKFNFETGVEEKNDKNNSLIHFRSMKNGDKLRSRLGACRLGV